MIVGFLNPDAEGRLSEHSAEWNEHLAQPFRDIVVAGALCDSAGARKGYLAFLESDSIEDADRYLRESPYYQAGLYERCEVLRYDVQVGVFPSERQGAIG